MRSIISATDAREMLKKWQGLSGPFAAEKDKDGRFVIEDENGLVVAVVEDFDEHTVVIANLLAGATGDVKALATTVVAQADEIEKLRRTLTSALASERARCAARVRDEAHRYAGLKSTATLRAIGAALDNVRRGIESGDTGAGTEAARDEVDYLDALLARHHTILTGVANALRGDPGATASHSHHDLAERAAAMVTERDAARADAAALRAAAREYLALRDAVAAHDTSSRPFTDYATFVLAIDKLTVARDALRSVIGGAS